MSPLREEKPNVIHSKFLRSQKEGKKEERNKE